MRLKFYQIVFIFVILSIIISIIVLVFLKKKRKKAVDRAVEQNPNTHLQESYYDKIPKWNQDQLAPDKIACNIFTYNKKFETDLDTLQDMMKYSDIDVNAISSDASTGKPCLSGKCSLNTYDASIIYGKSCYFPDQIAAQIYSHTCVSRNNDCRNFKGDSVPYGTVDNFAFQCNTEVDPCTGLMTLISLDYLIAGGRMCMQYQDAVGNTPATISYEECDETVFDQRFIVNKYNIADEDLNFVPDTKGSFIEIIYRDSSGNHKYLTGDPNDKTSVIFADIVVDTTANPKIRKPYTETVKWISAPQSLLTGAQKQVERRQYYKAGGIYSISEMDPATGDVAFKISGNPGIITFDPSPTGGVLVIGIIPNTAGWTDNLVGQFVITDPGHGYSNDNPPVNPVSSSGYAFQDVGAVTSDISHLTFTYFSDSKIPVKRGQFMVPDDKFDYTFKIYDSARGYTDNDIGGIYNPDNYNTDGPADSGYGNNRFEDGGVTIGNSARIGSGYLRDMLDDLHQNKEIPSGSLVGYYVQLLDESDAAKNHQMSRIIGFKDNRGYIVWSPAFVAPPEVTHGNNVRRINIFKTNPTTSTEFGYISSDPKHLTNRNEYYVSINTTPGFANDDENFTNSNSSDGILVDGTIQWKRIGLNQLSTYFGAKYSSAYLDGITNTDGVIMDVKHDDKKSFSVRDAGLRCGLNTFGLSPPQLIYLSDDTISTLKQSIKDKTLEEFIMNTDITSPDYGNANENLQTLQIVPTGSSVLKTYRDHDPYADNNYGPLYSSSFKIGLARFLPYTYFEQDEVCREDLLQTPGYVQQCHAYAWTQFIPFGQESVFKGYTEYGDLPSFSSLTS